MNIEEANQITIQTSLNAGIRSVEDGIEVSRMQYENINNDFFKEAKNKLEVFLFRLYECKFLIGDRISDFNRERYLTDDAYYKETWKTLRDLMDVERGEQAYQKGVSYIKEKNYEEAGKYFREAALAGNADGQYNYGLTVSNGEGCEADPLEGAFWYWEAAKRENFKAMMNLGVAYRNGNGVKESGIQMLWWYACSANSLENPVAVYNLGLCLKHEEVLSGSQAVGIALIRASDEMEMDRARKYVQDTTDQLKKMLEKYVYNVE